MKKQLIIIVLATMLITLMMPTRGIFEINTQRGDLWPGETLLAPFDIPIWKTPQEISNEKEQLSTTFIPIFRLDTTINNLTYADPTVQPVVAKGIMAEAELERNRGKNIRIIIGNEMRIVPAAELFSPKTATEYLAAQKITGFDPQVNLTYDATLNAAAREDAISLISRTRGIIRTGEPIVRNGQLVDEPTLLLLQSYTQQYRNRMGGEKGWLWIVLGRMVVVGGILLINLLFFIRFSPHYFGGRMKSLLFIVGLYILMAGLVAITTAIPTLTPWLVPLPVVAIYLLTFFNMRVAIFGNITVALLAGILVPEPFAYCAVNFIGGMVAIFMLRNFYHRANLFKAVGVIFLTELVLMTSFSLIYRGTIGVDILYNAGYLLVSMFLLLGFYQAIYLFERIFGFTSDLTLLELSDTNQPMLLNLAQQAPGTFQHSVQVANLAESAAKAIGANALLARCGALYHDIGKMQNPYYFAENLSGTFNPHNDLTPEASTEIIRRHVIDGLELARQAKLPTQVTAFIGEHHGQSLIYFFYAKAKELQGEMSVNPTQFRYPGANPVSKEVSICMMADAVEAASRSLTSYEKEPLGELVDKIIGTQISEGLLSSSQLSFAEVKQISELLKTKLYNIYHGRIAYPEREDANK